MKRHLSRFLLGIGIIVSAVLLLAASHWFYYRVIGQYAPISHYKHHPEAFALVADYVEHWPESTQVQLTKTGLKITDDAGDLRNIADLQDNQLQAALTKILGHDHFDMVAVMEGETYFIYQTDYNFMNGIVVTGGERPRHPYIWKSIPLGNGVYYFISE